MKKLFVLALAVVLTLSLTAVASAATFDPYIGGRITWSYVESDHKDYDGNPVHLDNSGIKLLLKGKVTHEETGTWGAIGAKIDGWPNDEGDLNGPNAIYDFGINNIGGSNFSIWYSNWENENMNRGQGRIHDSAPAKYHEDFLFDRDMANVIGIDYKTDKLAVNFGYVPDENKNNGDNDFQIAFTYNFDGGKVHAGYWSSAADKDWFQYPQVQVNNTKPVEVKEYIIGGEFKAGFGTIKADYITLDCDDIKYNGNKVYDGGSLAQVNVSFDDLKFDVTLVYDDGYKFKTDGGYGYQIRYTGFDNITLAYRAFEADKKVDEHENFTDFYIGYKYGIFETRLGYGTVGEGKDNDRLYASVYISFW